MFKRIVQLLLISLFAVGLIACSNKGNEDGNDSSTNTVGKLQLVATFSIIYDMLQEIGGDLVEVHSMVPLGTDPHEYEPLPEDIKKAINADALFYNGLNLEGGDNGWFLGRLVRTANKDESVIYEVMEGVSPLYLTSDDGHEEEINPHAFLSPKVGIKMAENIMKALSEIDPDNASIYEENGKALLAQLEEIDQMYEEKVNDIPEEHRYLVTSERAFQYLADDYGLEEGYIWAIDTDENGTPEQIKTLIEYIKEHDIDTVFVESNVDKRPMETVVKETGAKIHSEIYSDELGSPGSDGATFLELLESNITRIHEGLAKK